MDEIAQYLISKDDGKLQIPYSEYKSLMEKAMESERIQKVKSQVLENLQGVLDGRDPSIEVSTEVLTTATEEEDDQEGQIRAEPSEKVSVEFAPDSQPSANEKPAANGIRGTADVPPLKKEVEDYFNSRDASGRLLNVFKQYYTCLNESCGGIVRVTLKDGILSLLNYDKWEDFAFVDIHEDELRFTLDSRYTDDLCSLEFCEVARLLSVRRSFIAIRVEDLNKTMLEVLTRAFAEVDLTTG